MIDIDKEKDLEKEIYAVKDIIDSKLRAVHIKEFITLYNISYRVYCEKDIPSNVRFYIPDEIIDVISATVNIYTDFKGAYVGFRLSQFGNMIYSQVYGNFREVGENIDVIEHMSSGRKSIEITTNEDTYVDFNITLQAKIVM